MNIKMRLIALILILIGPSSALAKKIEFDTVKGLLTCEIKHQEITKIKDGKVFTYSGFADLSKQGDDLELAYEFVSMGNSNNEIEVKVELKNPILEDNLLYAYFSSELDKILLTKDERKIIIENLFFRDPFVFSEDRMRFEGHFGELTLTRYYKNDYHGIYFRHRMGDFIQIAVLDCRTIVDAVDEVIELFKLSGKKAK